MSKHYIASLPWYDSERKHHALDQFWQAAAQSLHHNGFTSVQRELVRNQPLTTLWQSSNMILSQCCGPDLFTESGSDLCVVARPVFAKLDCTPGCYYSYIVSRTESLNTSARIAVNSLSSRSGYTALTEWMSCNGLEVSDLQLSGSHMNSLTMLEQGLADLAAVDAHTVNQLGIELTLPVIDNSTEALSPPYAYHANAELGNDSLLQALTHATQTSGIDIGVTDIVPSDRALYEEFFTTTYQSK